MTIVYSAVPFINLFLLFFQTGGLATTPDTLTAQVNLGQITDFKLYYVVMALYSVVIGVLLYYSYHLLIKTTKAKKKAWDL
jgi:hypothetical protein